MDKKVRDGGSESVRQANRGQHFVTVRSVGTTHDWHAAVEPVSLYWPAGQVQGQKRNRSLSAI